MIGLEAWVGLAIVVSLNLYALTGGADFGGGVLDLLASGPRAERQRATIAEAIAPIWEANHVWLIVVIVLLFAAFPPAFAALGTALHIPLALMLVGIVLRGAAFAFRSYGIQPGAATRRWSRVFSVSSTLTPVMLGVSLGAAISGAIRLDAASGVPTAGFFRPWLAPFPWAMGCFALALFVFLAAVYLCVETEEPTLREDFRRRALAAGLVVGLLAWLSLALARQGAPWLLAGLALSSWAVPFQIVTGAAAVGALAALWRRRFRLARVLAVVQVSLIVWGWALAQYPYLLVPDLTLSEAAAEPAVLRPLLVILALGALLLAPAFVYLYAVFKRPRRVTSRAPQGSEAEIDR